jgi:DNA-binding IclR family transcriptional regulator
MKAMLASVHAARKLGYSIAQETFAAGVNALGTPVQLNGQPPMGVISISGPTVRFTADKMRALAPQLMSAAAQMAAASGASPFLARRPANVGA